ncbi:MAG: hypothetical protein KY476_00525 [Planctomycetes bacterium]|nr:hypothetical protein [Planctomycetota bacterium]
MADFVVNLAGLSAAEAAVRYALERVVHDPDFRWHMLHTHTLRLCLIAEAERRGLPVEAVEADLQKAIAKRGRRDGEPYVVRLERERDELEQKLAETKCKRQPNAPAVDDIQAADLSFYYKRLDHVLGWLNDHYRHTAQLRPVGRDELARLAEAIGVH